MLFLSLLVLVFFGDCEEFIGLTASLVQLNKIDVKTLKMTPIGQPQPDMDSPQLSSLDVKNSIFYLLTEDTTTQKVHLTGIGTEKGDLLYHIPLPFSEYKPLIGVGQTIDVDPETGDVFCTGYIYKENTHRIYRITPKTGEMKLLGTIPYISLFAADSGYNPKRGILYLKYMIDTGKNDLVVDMFGFNVETGKIVSEVSDDNYNMISMEYDPVTDRFYGIGYNGSKAGTFFNFLSYDLENKHQIIAQLPSRVTNSLPSIAAIDMKNRVLLSFLTEDFQQEAFHLVQIDLKTGKIVSTNPPICTIAKPSPYPYCPYSLEYTK